MTQVARGLDPDGLLLLDVAVHGVIPESLADADLQAQVRVSPGCTEGCTESVGCPACGHPDSPAGVGAWPSLDFRGDE